MRNLRLTIAYDGSAYSGWQIQPIAPTVQGAVERVLRHITQHPCRLRAAGRTDAGVHAEGQVASCLTPTKLSCTALLRGLNALLPADVTVRSVDEADLDFDPRRDSKGKHYRYMIHNSALPPTEHRGHVHVVRQRLDLGAMARAAWKLVGTHDFAAFRAADCERDNTVRRIFRCSISHAFPLVSIDVEGTAFLKHMVRIIAGTLLAIGIGRLDELTIPRLLERRDRREAGMTVPANGLCLVKVFLS